MIATKFTVLEKMESRSLRNQKPSLKAQKMFEFENETERQVSLSASVESQSVILGTLINF